MSAVGAFVVIGSSLFSVGEVYGEKTALFHIECFETQDGNLVLSRNTDCPQCLGVRKDEFVSGRQGSCLYSVGKYTLQIANYSA
jgi:hypothetical protein